MISSEDGYGVASWFLPHRGLDGLKWASRAGFAAVHIDGDDVALASPAAIRDLADSTGLTLAGLSVVDLERFGLQAGVAEAAVDNAIGLAGSMGISYVYLPAFGRATLRDDGDIARMAQLLDHALTRSRDQGLTIATENSLGARGLVALIGSRAVPRLELLFDTQNPTVAGVDPLTLIQAGACHIRSFVHVKDGLNGLGDARLGDGTANVAASMRALLVAGFSGTFVVENNYCSDGLRKAIKDLDWLRRMTSEGAQYDGGSAT